MALAPVGFSPEGATITDEAVACTEATVIGATTYYVGRLAERPRPSVLGASGSYGAWTAASMGGTRLTVVQALPTGTGELGVDFASGRAYSTSSRTVYVRYVGHGEFLRSARMCLGGVASGLHVTGTTKDLLVLRVPQRVEVVGYALCIQPGGLAPGAAVALTVRGARSGGGSALTAETLDLGSGQTDSAATAFTTPWAVEAGGLVVVRGDGKNCQHLGIQLFARPA